MEMNIIYKSYPDLDNIRNEHNITLAQIGDHIGISKERVRQLIHSSKGKKYEAVVDFILDNNFAPYKLYDIITNKQGSKATIVHIQGKKLTIRFNDKHQLESKISSSSVINGVFSRKNPYHPNILGVGYMGVGQYNSVNSEHQLNMWRSMLERCYNFKMAHKYPSVGNYKVCSRWHNFQSFCADALESNIIKLIKLHDATEYNPNTIIGMEMIKYEENTNQK